MGLLYEKIKKHLENVVAFQDKQEADYVKETTFNNLYKTTEELNSLNYFLVEINDHKTNYFGSIDNYKAFLDENRNVFTKSVFDLPYATIASNGKVDVKSVDYEAMLDTIEKKIGTDKTNELIQKFEQYNPTIDTTVSNPFTPLVNDIINDMSDLDLTEEEKNEIIDSLNYANSEIVEKHGNPSMDKLIDKVSLVRDTVAQSKVIEVSNNHGIDADKVVALKEKQDSIAFDPNTNEKKDLIKPFVESDLVYSQDYKQKILELDKLVTENGLIPDGVVGETGFKEYGFVDYFNKVTQVKDLLVNQTKLVSQEDKINNLREIKQKTDELKDVVNKYNNVIDFIKENFDIDKINLNGNIYTGRIFAFEEGKYSQFRPNLPLRWDNKNSIYGVVLNGYAQLKGAAKMAGVSIEEYMNHPIKSYLNGAKNMFKAEDDKYYLPDTEENTLGKRIANALVMESAAYDFAYTNYAIYSRGIEFLNNTSEINDNTYSNIIKSAAGKSLIVTHNHSSDLLFTEVNGQTDYQSIQNLFALGRETDKLYEVSTKYYSDNLEKAPLAKSYDNMITNKKQVNALNETRRVMETLKNFMVERKRLNDEHVSDDPKVLPLVDKVPAPHLFVGAKKYMNDFIYKNNIDLLAINKKERKEIMDFLEDPLKAFENKYKDEPNFFLVDDTGALKENYKTFREEFKAEFDRLNKNNAEKFIETFNDLNAKTKGRNSDKSILQIIENNKGGFWEQRIGTTSKEYKALESSVVAAFDPQSQTYGDLSGAKIYAQKYIDHKLPEGVNFDKLSENEKRRIEFCQTIIGTSLKIQFDSQTEEKNVVYAPDNQVFQQKLKVDVDLGLENNNNIIIDENELEKEKVITQ